MTSKLSIFALLAFLTTSAQAEPDVDTLYRAAYCVACL
jgi:hypothetical protein